MRIRSTIARICALTLVAAAAFLLSSCASERKEIASPQQLNSPEYVVCVDTTSYAALAARESFPKATLKDFNMAENGYFAVQQGKADAIAYERSLMQYAINQGLSGVKLLDEGIGEKFDIAVGITRNNRYDDLKSLLDSFLTQMANDGTIDAMTKYWMDDCNINLPDLSGLPKPTESARTLVVGTSALVTPYTFYTGTELTGFDIELMLRFGAYYDFNIEFMVYDYPGLIAASEAGAIDCICANLNITEERRVTIDYSIPYIETQTALMVKDFSAVDDYITSVDQCNGRPAGSIVGMNYDGVYTELFPDSPIMPYNSVGDAVTALKSGKIGYIVINRQFAERTSAANDDIMMLNDILASNDNGLAFSKTDIGDKLRDEVNEFIGRISDNGTLDEVMDNWHGENGANTMPFDYTALPATNGTVNAATYSGLDGFAFIQDNALVGSDIELLARFCKEYGYALHIEDMDFSAVIAAVSTGKADIAAACITITEERAENMNFSVPIYTEEVTAIVRADVSENPMASLFDSLASAFISTFIREDRYKLIFEGIVVTLIITVCAAFLGTLLAVPLCVIRRSGNKVVRNIAKAYIRVIQGTPIVVILMVLYYVVFASSDVNAIIVAIVGFSLNAAAYVSEMLRSGIDAVDKGQLEGAYALGYNKIRCFFKVILPQAVQYMLPVYTGTVIDLMKTTSIVGYIAIQDLTKASDIIRSRTYLAFMPLISTAVIYFLLALLLTRVLSLIQKRLDPSKRKRRVKGVKERSDLK